MRIDVSAASLAGILVGALSVSGATQTTSSAANPTENLTVTGCLRENPARPGAYLLDSIEGSGGEKSYRLIGSGSADLKPHVGHKVKVTGTVAKSTAGGAAPATGASSDDGPAMNVTIVAHVADTCPVASR